MKFSNIKFGDPSGIFFQLAFLYRLAEIQLNYVKEAFNYELDGKKFGLYKLQFLALLYAIDLTIRESYLGKPKEKAFMIADSMHFSEVQYTVKRFERPDFDIKFESLKYIPYFYYENNKAEIKKDVFMKLLDYSNISEQEFSEASYKKIIEIFLYPWVKQFIGYAEYKYGKVIYFYSDVYDDNVATDDTLTCSVCHRSMKGQRYVYYKSIYSDEKPYCEECFGKAEVSPYGREEWKKVEIATGITSDETVWFLEPRIQEPKEESLFKKIKDIFFKKGDNE